jgi:hypothetical protein
MVKINKDRKGKTTSIRVNKGEIDKGTIEMYVSEGHTVRVRSRYATTTYTKDREE